MSNSAVKTQVIQEMSIHAILKELNSRVTKSNRDKAKNALEIKNSAEYFDCLFSPEVIFAGMSGSESISKTIDTIVDKEGLYPLVDKIEEEGCLKVIEVDEKSQWEEDMQDKFNSIMNQWRNGQLPGHDIESALSFLDVLGEVENVNQVKLAL